MKPEREFEIRCEIAGWVAAAMAEKYGFHEGAEEAISKFSVDVAHHIVMDTATKMKEQENRSRELSRRMKNK